MASEILEYAKRGGRVKEAASGVTRTFNYDNTGNVVSMVEKADAGFGLKDIWKGVVGKAAVPGLVLGAVSLNHLYGKIKNDSRRRAIFESLCWDPEFRDMDKSQLLEWFTTIYHYAPDITLDKVSVKELLKQFRQFDRVDIQTLKTLAETQKNVSESRSKDSIVASLWK